MATKTIADIDVSGKTVLMRVDFNVPLAEGKVTDDKRIAAALPSIRKVVAGGGKLVLMSHLGRPKGKVVEAMRMAPVGARLSELLGKPVGVVSDCVGTGPSEAAGAMQPGSGGDGGVQPALSGRGGDGPGRDRR